MGANCSLGLPPVPTLDHAEREIKDLHEFFTAWYSGAERYEKMDEKEKDVAFQSFTDRFHSDFEYVMPSGKKFSKRMILDLRQVYGTSPDFKIKIENVKMKHVPFSGGRVISGTYKEFQTGAKNSTDDTLPLYFWHILLLANMGFNGQLFSLSREAPNELNTNRLRIHETWLPEEEINKFDFTTIT